MDKQTKVFDTTQINQGDNFRRNSVIKPKLETLKFIPSPLDVKVGSLEIRRYMKKEHYEWLRAHGVEEIEVDMDDQSTTFEYLDKDGKEIDGLEERELELKTMAFIEDELGQDLYVCCPGSEWVDVSFRINLKAKTIGWEGSYSDEGCGVEALEVV